MNGPSTTLLREVCVMPIYMKYEGAEGSVTAEGHQKWIEVESCRMGGSRQIRNATGRGVNREASVPSISEMVLSKQLDCASTTLFQLFLDGEGSTVQIDFCKTDQN